jgi:hypothetical protein
LKGAVVDFSFFEKSGNKESSRLQWVIHTYIHTYIPNYSLLDLGFQRQFFGAKMCLFQEAYFLHSKIRGLIVVMDFHLFPKKIKIKKKKHNSRAALN